jgi:arginyl-tRNA synthetase
MSDVLLGVERDLDQLFKTAAAQAFGNDVTFDPVIRPSKHADFQANGALAMAKQLGRPPRDVATELLAALDDPDGIIKSTEIAGPGFINLVVGEKYLEQRVEEISGDESAGIPTTETHHTYVVDYGAPNIAKNMHVGHLRTSIIGDAFCRMLAALGHTVVRHDHQGDWGTQFGMLIEHLVDSGDPEATAKAAVHDLDALYKQARAKFDSDEAFATRARERVVLLQSGDEYTRSLWQTLVNTSRKHFAEVYGRLGVLLTEDDVRGESYYNDMLEDTVQQLIDKGLAKVDDGALCVYPPGFKGREGEPFALIIRKSDGGFNYATTDLATVRDSVDRVGGDRLLYVTDKRQAQHFAMIFAVCRQAGWLRDGVDAIHVGYGMVMGEDNKPFKTRTGETVKLAGLLDEAVERAEKALTERTTDLTDEQRHEIARAVGIGAVKWADLKNEHTTDYVFDFDRMLAFSGNTGPYVQYASTRAKSVLRKAESTGGAFIIGEEAERQLALRLTAFSAAVVRSVETYEPHHLCGYLFDLADAFTSFYENCPVLSVTGDVRESRLAFCAVTAKVLDAGLELLGIKPVQRM